MSAGPKVQQVEMILIYKKILGSLRCFENQKQITKATLTFLTVTWVCVRIRTFLAYFYTFGNCYNSLCLSTIEILY